MDYNESLMGFKYRHPWELSRTDCVLKYIDRYISQAEKMSADVKYLNVGAGDCYFDARLLEKHRHTLYAVDIAYPEESVSGNNVATPKLVVPIPGQPRFFRSIDEIKPSIRFDYGLLMDSLEYMDDDRYYLEQLSCRIKDGGYIILTLPYNSKIYSEHDVLVGNKRRYGLEEIGKVVDSIEGIEIVASKCFYFSLFLYRKIQLLLKMQINPKITTGWTHDSDSFVTRLIRRILNADYKICGKIGFTGLSLLVIIQKKEPGKY